MASDRKQFAGGKIIVFKFTGGPRHGEIIRTDQSHGAREAQSLWAMTWQGTVGRRVDVSSQTGPLFQRYQVMSNCQIDEEIHIVCQHVQ